MTSVHAIRTICLAAVFMPAALQAEELVVVLDGARTKIDFVLGDILHTVHGNFQLKEGKISFDPSAGVIRGDIIVDAASGNSGSRIRDKRMTRDVLEAARYPEVRFSPTAYSGSIAMEGTSNIEVRGSFLIHGQTHEITIPMQIQISREEIAARCKLTVPYVRWGMKNPSTFLLKVSQEVEIDVNAVGRVSGSPGARN